MRVLIIAEAPSGSVDALDLVLAHAGHQVAIATTAADVRAQLGCARPDLVMSTGPIAGLPLSEVLDLLDADPHTRGLPVLLCPRTARLTARAAAHLERPRTGLLREPYGVHDLFAQLTELTNATGAT